MFSEHVVTTYLLVELKLRAIIKAIGATRSLPITPKFSNIITVAIGTKIKTTEVKNAAIKKIGKHAGFISYKKIVIAG